MLRILQLLFSLLLVSVVSAEAQQRAEELLWQCKGNVAEQLVCTAYLESGPGCQDHFSPAIS